MPAALDEDGFWARVKKGDGCWDWQLSTCGGYGQLSFKGRPKRAHRLALELSLGRELAEGEMALHGCDNRLCCRVAPGHVYLGDHSRNMKDAIDRRRFTYAERSGTARLGWEQVELIGKLWQSGESVIGIRERLGGRVSRAAIYMVINGETWLRPPGSQEPVVPAFTRRRPRQYGRG